MGEETRWELWCWADDRWSVVTGGRSFQPLGQPGALLFSVVDPHDWLDGVDAVAVLVGGQLRAFAFDPGRPVLDGAYVALERLRVAMATQWSQSA